MYEGILDPTTTVGSLGGASNKPSNVHVNAFTNSLRVKRGPGILYGFTVFSSAAAAQFIQVFDLDSLPADGAIPAVVFTVGAAANIAANWIPGRAFQVGCVICNSSTAPTKTIGNADSWFDVQYL
jgi:hypothetical protein